MNNDYKITILQKMNDEELVNFAVKFENTILLITRDFKEVEDYIDNLLENMECDFLDMPEIEIQAY